MQLRNLLIMKHTFPHNFIICSLLLEILTFYTPLNCLIKLAVQNIVEFNEKNCLKIIVTTFQ